MVFAVVIALSLVIAPRSARADDDVARARELFVKGGQLVKDADWANALVAFEESSKLRSHPVTTFNVGQCLRAMGQYTRARRAFATALSEGRYSIRKLLDTIDFARFPVDDEEYVANLNTSDEWARWSQ